MTYLLDECSPKDQSLLLDRFHSLENLCVPPCEIALPSFTFKKKEVFTATDTLPYSIGAMLRPDELVSYDGLDKSMLRGLNLDYIKTKNQKWFFNTSEKDGVFFSKDGQKKVEIGLDFWMDAEKIWSIPGIKNAMRCVLQACEGDSFPTNTQAQKFFSDEICHKIYQKQPSFKIIQHAVLGIIEPFRKTLVTELTTKYANDISKSPKFQKYVKQKKLDSTKNLRALTEKYLKENKNAIFLFGEKFGLIKNARKAIHYQKVRDSERHPAEVKALLAKPEKVYQDFCRILGQPCKTNTMIKPNGKIIENLEISNNLEYMSEILVFLKIVSDKSLKEYKPEWWQDLIDKGIVTPDEVDFLKDIIPKTTAVAHVNDGSDAHKSDVADTNGLLELSLDMSKRHEKREENKRIQLKKRLDEDCYSF